jgi:hypothetical protein
MPVKIVDSQTRSAFGEIKLNDLLTIKSEFADHAAVSPTAGRTVAVNKKYSFYFSKDQFLQLFDKKPGDLGVKINIGIQNDPTEDICHNNEGNNMCVVVETFENKDNKNPESVLDGYVLINGFENNGEVKIFSNTVCCPSSDPA